MAVTIVDEVEAADGDRAAHDALLVSVVVPVYGNRETLPEVVRRLEGVSDRLEGRMEAIFVIDGSPDDSGPLLRVLLDGSRLRSRLLWHSRNFGSFAAVRTGLAAARGRCMVVMSADLQEPVELAISLYEALARGECDVAVGVRRARADPRASRVGSSWFWSIYCRWVQPEMPRGGIDVFACTPEVRDALQALHESNSSLVGLLIWLGYRRVEIPYDRAPRASGRSGWTVRKKVRYLFDSIYSFTDLPINLLLAVGVTGVLLSSAGGVTVLLVWALAGIRVAGYTPIMLTLLVMGSLTLSGLGVVGSYVWRTYENSKRRPHAVSVLSESFHDPEDE
ncbi:MAG TPA: glycosyltransferase family 2 protein [Solirubrobacteraceae bacterium]|nr:glycosyltransferase family 2 protein [Solirubrobacteraceae bacterium]